MEIQLIKDIQIYSLLNDKLLIDRSNIPEKTVAKDDIEVRKNKLRKAANDFEAIFARQILKSMRSTLEDGGMFGSGSIGEIYSDMMDNAISEIIAKRGELGLANSIYKQMIKYIEPDIETNAVGSYKNIIKDTDEK